MVIAHCLLHLGLAKFLELVSFLLLLKEIGPFHLVDLHEFFTCIGNIVLLGLPVFEPLVKIIHRLKLPKHILYLCQFNLGHLRNLLLSLPARRPHSEFLTVVKSRQNLVLGLKSFNFSVLSVEHLLQSRLLL